MGRETEDIRALVGAAQKGEEAAFTRLVYQFQDMAVGYAWSVLGDFHLAEDAAQDAFLEAHRCLGQLRQPLAWAHWLRQLVFKHCDRRLRRARLQTVEIEAVAPLVDRSAASDERLEREEMEKYIRHAVLELPKSERQTISLFYFSGHSQVDVADFLDVSVPTVKRLLRSARGLLQEKTMQWIEESLSSKKPSQDADYAKRVLSMVRAVSAGDVERVGQLLREDLRLLRAPGGRWQRPPLHQAAEYGHQAVMELLLARGAEITDADQMDHATPLHWAAEGGQIEIVRLLVEMGADLNDCSDDHEMGPLGWACRGQHVRREVAEYLLTQGAVLDIFSAIALGDAEAVKRLVAAEADVLERKMSRNEHFRTPLHFAVDRRQLAIAKLLLEKGAAPSAGDALGAPPLALLCAPQCPFNSVADEALKKEWVELFATVGVELDLYSAVSMGFYEQAKALLEMETRTSADGETIVDGEAVRVLHFVALGNLVPTLSWLLEQGVDANAPALVWGCTATPLHFAVEHGLVEVVEVFLRAGADLQARDDKYDSTPLGWAEHCGQEEVAALIRQHL